MDIWSWDPTLLDSMYIQQNFHSSNHILAIIIRKT
jgi:hypothetical protein